MHGGFLQVFENSVTLLTDRAELVEGERDAAREAARALVAKDDEAQAAGIDG